MEERRLRTDDNPTSLLYERFQATAYQTSPYKDPVIGWMNDLQHMKVDDLKKWYTSWYGPNNATLVVVGDVDPEKVFQLAKKYYGRVKPIKVHALKPQKEVRQLGEKRMVLKVPAQVPYILMGYKVPVLTDDAKSWEPYALEVLSGILDGGSSARLTRELVRGKQIASQAGSSYDIYSRLSNMLLLDGTPAENHTIPELEAALREQITQLRTAPVSDTELKRIKAQVVASKVYGQDSMFYQGMQIGMLESVGLDASLLDKYVDRIRAVTAKQVQEVAKKYLTDDRLTVGILEPQAGKRVRVPAASGVMHGVR
jgi:zinc protease